MELELASLYQRQGDIKKALSHVGRAPKAGSQTAGGLFFAGRLACGPQPDLAVVLEKRSSLPGPGDVSLGSSIISRTNTRAWARMGRLLLILNRYGEAQKAFARVKALEKNDLAELQ